MVRFRRVTPVEVGQQIGKDLPICSHHHYVQRLVPDAVDRQGSTPRGYRRSPGRCRTGWDPRG